MTSMSQTPQNAPIDQQQDADLQSALTALQEENQALKHKLAWFERQLFGTKSEKRLIDDPAQTGLLFGETLKPTSTGADRSHQLHPAQAQGPHRCGHRRRASL